MAMTLGYWDIRGLAQPIRLLMVHAEAAFNDKLYKCGPPPTYDRSEWLNEKFSMGLDFPNLPYLIDGDVKLSQSLTITRYLARKFNLAGKTEAEKQRVDLAEQVLQDMRYGWAMMCYKPEFEELKIEYLKELPDKLKSLSNFLGDHHYFAGNELTHVDFIAYEFLDQQLVLKPTALDQFDNLKHFHARVQALPNIAKYLASDRCIKYPLNGAPAVFGGAYSKK